MKLTTTKGGIFASLLIASVFFLTPGCKKQNIAPSSITPNSSGSATSIITPCGEPVVSDLIAGQNMVSGSITVQNDQDSVYITFATANGWMLGKTHLYVGELQNMPSTPNGNPQIGNFPYQHTFNPMVLSDQYAIALTDLPACFIVAAHAETHLIGSNGEIVQSETSWGNGTQLNESGSWAMYSSYCVQECDEPCVFSTQSYDLFGGQTILVGNLLVTNDQDSLTITYQTSGDWFIGKIHVYVGALSGLPVNGQNAPIPGQFPYSETYNPYTQTATIRVALADLPPCYIIAAHAEMHKIVNGEDVQQETAWSYGTPFQDTDRWGWTSDYCTQICE